MYCDSLYVCVSVTLKSTTYPFPPHTHTHTHTHIQLSGADRHDQHDRIHIGIPADGLAAAWDAALIPGRRLRGGTLRVLEFLWWLLTYL